MQKGSALLFVILAIVLIISLGLFFIAQRSIKTDTPISPQPALNEEAETVYREPNLGFEFKYPKDLTVKKDTEEEFNKRGNGDFRKNFSYYVTYPPADVLGAVVVLEKEGNYDTNPFTVWLFDNPDELTIDKWHHDFWYYPFVWGDFTYTGKFELAPKDEATISGQMSKSGMIDYKEGKPKFVYVSKDKKMYLLRVIGEKGDKILQSFKLL